MTKELSTISVSEIAQTAGIGKGSIYYYFPSKEAILEALVKRSYEAPLDTAKHLAEQTDISPFRRVKSTLSSAFTPGNVMHIPRIVNAILFSKSITSRPARFAPADHSFLHLPF